MFRSEPLALTQPAPTNDPSLELAGSFRVPGSRKRQQHTRGNFRISQHNCFFIRKGSWLNKIGVSGSFGFYAVGKFLYQSIWLSFGFRLPCDMFSKLLSIELITSHPDSYWSDIHISSGRIRVRNMVTRHSKFLEACLRADLHLVRRCLETGEGGINDVDGDGATPLHVS